MELVFLGFQLAEPLFKGLVAVVEVFEVLELGFEADSVFFGVVELVGQLVDLLEELLETLFVILVVLDDDLDVFLFVLGLWREIWSPPLN